MTALALVFIIGSILYGATIVLDALAERRAPTRLPAAPKPLPPLGKCLTSNCGQPATVVKFDGELLNLCRDCADQISGELVLP